MPRPGCPPSVFCPDRRAVATRLPPTRWRGCRFLLVRRHRTRNGAGKTTTLRALTGLTRPDAGQATIAGHRFAELPNADFRAAASALGVPRNLS